MGNHTATRSRGRGKPPGASTGGARRASAGQPSTPRWQGGGGEPATTFLDHTPTADSARPTVYASPTQRAAIHLQALGTVGLHREDASGFDAQGRRIFHKAGARDAVDFTAAEIETLRGQALLHNHPSGTSFSENDIQTGARFGITMHVVGAPPLPPGADPTRTTSRPAYLFTMRYGPVPSDIPRGSAAHQEFLDERARRIERVYYPIHEEVYQRNLDRIVAGTMTIDEANRVHAHQVWNRIASILPDDLSYTWEMLTP